MDPDSRYATASSSSALANSTKESSPTSSPSTSPSVSRSQSVRSEHGPSGTTSQGSLLGSKRQAAGSSPLASGSTILATEGQSAYGTVPPAPSTPRRKRATTHSKGSASMTPSASGGSGTPSRATPKARDRHTAALASIRAFLQGRSSYDVLPVSFRVIVLDTRLVIKPALDVMWQAGIVSAPLWHSSPIPKPASGKANDEGEAATSPLQHGDEEPSKLTEPAATAVGDSATATATTTPADLTQNPSSAPVARKHGFAGMLTVNDIIHLIQYYYQHSSYDSAAQDVEHFRLEMLSDIERYLKVPQPPLLSIHPLRPLYEACQMLIRTHARRLPLLDYDEQTGIETVVSVITQYRVLKFIAMNCRETMSLTKSIRQLGIGTFTNAARAGRSTMATSQSNSSGQPSRNASVSVAANPSDDLETTPPDDFRPSTRAQSHSPEPLDSVPSPSSNPYAPLATATLDTTVFDVVHLFSELGISAVPILDSGGHVVDLYETVDVITLVRTSAYQSLDLTIRQALRRRPADFPGVYTCGPDDSLASIFALLRKRRVHRLLILEPVLPEGPGEAHGAESSGQGNVEPLRGEDDTPTPLSNTTDPLEEALADQTPRKAAAVPTATTQIPLDVLDAELESGVTRRRGRGKLVGILCLSDILRYVIGASGSGAGGGKARAGTGVSPAHATTVAAQVPAPEKAQTSRQGDSESAGTASADVAATTSESPDTPVAAQHPTHPQTDTVDRVDDRTVGRAQTEKDSTGVEGEPKDVAQGSAEGVTSEGGEDVNAA